MSHIPAALVLADGRVFPGRSFGAPPHSIERLINHLFDGSASLMLNHFGEVVFNTAMSGYPEVLTDPSYTGQIVAMTYPHIGNYGVDVRWGEVGPATDGEREIQPAGMIVHDLYQGPVPAGRVSLDEYLKEGKIPGVAGLDTRALTIYLREHGAQTACICRVPEGNDTEREELYRQLTEALSRFPSMEGRGLIEVVGSRVSTVVEDAAWCKPAVPLDEPRGATKPVVRGGSSRVVLYDCGAKGNIVRELIHAGCEVTVVPSRSSAQEILSLQPDAVMVTNGPGDPAVLTVQIDTVKGLIGRVPLLGICLGHQLIAEALGARTYKMPFGHHGLNHPVRDERTGRVFVTSQNHGFAVEESSLPDGVEVWFRNANDQTIEGIRDDTRTIRTAQFHPESAPGPTDSRWIFAAFLEGVSSTRARKKRGAKRSATTSRKTEER